MQKMRSVCLGLSTLLVWTYFAWMPNVTWAENSSAPRNAYLYIGWPNHGEVIKTTTFRIWFGLRHMGVAPAGTGARPNTGHHHVIIDSPLPPFDEPIPADREHLHFGAGQTEAVLELEPGQHTLQLLFADHNHIPHHPPVYSKQITIVVKPR